MLQDAVTFTAAHTESLGFVTPTFPRLKSGGHLLQVSGWSGAKSLHAEVGGASSVAYKGMLDCFARTVSEEGWQALFKVCHYHAS